MTTQTWWYLSFAGEEGFRGGVIVTGWDFLSAVLTSHALRINPGGEVLGHNIPEEHLPAAAYRDRLLTREELDDAFVGGMVLVETEAAE